MTLSVRPSEQLLIDSIDELPSGRLLGNTVGRGQFAISYAQRHPALPVACWFLDLQQLEQSRAVHPALPPNLQFICAADPPAEPFDLVAWAFSRQGDGELLREMLQIGHERLSPGGRLLATIDYPRDRWLHEQLQRLFGKVTRRESKAGALYTTTKAAPLRKHKNYSAEFAFRDGQRLIQLRTRPSVFSHRELDGGARALLKALHVEPGQRLLDLGCGSGAVGIAAAVRQPAASIDAIDSNSRAVQAALSAKDLNNVLNFRATLDCDGRTLDSDVYDIVLANPPYYSEFKIARLFLKIAARVLTARGQLLLVTKTPEWFQGHLGPTFAEPTIQPVGNYNVLSVEKRQIV